MEYQEFAPSPQLHPLVSSYWRFALSPSHTPAVVDHVVPPDGTVNICWLPSRRAVVLGPRITALHVPARAGDEYVGIRFMPGAAGPLLGVDVCSLRDAVAPIERTDFADAAGTFAIAGFDAVVRGWVARATGEVPDAVVAATVARLVAARGAVSVSTLADGTGLGYRQLLRRFRHATGLTPKEFARIRRVRAVCVEALTTSHLQWAGVSANAGFADQSHLTREFRDVFGWPPRLVLEYLRRIEHRDVTA